MSPKPQTSDLLQSGWEGIKSRAYTLVTGEPAPGTTGAKLKELERTYVDKIKDDLNKPKPTAADQAKDALTIGRASQALTSEANAEGIRNLSAQLGVTLPAYAQKTGIDTSNEVNKEGGLSGVRVQEDRGLKQNTLEQLGARNLLEGQEKKLGIEREDALARLGAQTSEKLRLIDPLIGQERYLTGEEQSYAREALAHAASENDKNRALEREFLAAQRSQNFIGGLLGTAGNLLAAFV
jgi:hypothetical protein